MLGVVASWNGLIIKIHLNEMKYKQGVVNRPWHSVKALPLS